jgi:hypothetical protein
MTVPSASSWLAGRIGVVSGALQASCGRGRRCGDIGILVRQRGDRACGGIGVVVRQHAGRDCGRHQRHGERWAALPAASAP